MEFRNWEDALTALKGHILQGVVTFKGKWAFRTEGGHEIWLQVDGDCCSYSWVETIDLDQGVIGSKILGWDSISIGDCIAREGQDCVQAYELRLHTEKGDVVVAFRNDSNGYYGGYVLEGNTPSKTDRKNVRTLKEEKGYKWDDKEGR